ncbi:MAG: YabP/YqfC family sporulation protein [Candidatus Caccosoma sp.]|nr:YabP/YqfC family sporulation protein [Candidatus Caccosoma sp.]
MIYIFKNIVKIQKYQKLLSVNDYEISILLFNKKIKIKGKDLIINYFEKEEINIKGNITNIEFYDD